MSERIMALLDSKYAVIIAFLPVVNLAYLIFRLMFVRIKSIRIPFWFFFIIAIPAVVLYNIVPEPWGWGVTHFVISCIAVCYIIKSRGLYDENIGFNPNAFWLAVAVFLLACFAYVKYTTWPADSMGPRKEKIYEAVEALACNNEEAWLEYVHPEHGGDLTDFSRMRKRFEVKLAGLEGGFEIVRKYNIILFTREVEDGKAAGAEVCVASKGSGEVYRISGVWQECEHGSGFIEFVIAINY